MKRFFLFGAGYSVRRLAQMLAGKAKFAGTNRDLARAEKLRAYGIAPLHFDGGSAGPEVEAALADATHLLISIPPSAGHDAALEITRHFRPGNLRWIGYLSSTGVYGDRQGGWVDEQTPCQPVMADGKARLAAENGWQELGREMGVPVAALRLAGIYGPGRNAFVQLERGAARRVVKPGHVFNRIHVEDIARAILHLADAEQGGIYNLADNEPAPPQDLITHAAQIMGVVPPEEIPFAEAEMSPGLRSFYAEHRRISNAAIKNTGFRLTYPDYRAGLDALWQGGDWR